MATISPVVALKSPAHVPGEKATEFLHAGVHVIKSSDVNYNDTSPAQIFQVPANTLVVDIILQVVTAFNGTGAALTVGDGDDADGFLDATAAAAAAAGYKSIKQDLQPYSGGKVYSALDTIDVVITPGTGASAGTFRAWLVYKCYDDENLS